MGCDYGVFQLEEGHTGRLERTEDLWLRVRKDHAPRLARLSLESRSLRDVLLHGESPSATFWSSRVHLGSKRLEEETVATFTVIVTLVWFVASACFNFW